jgi:hypothetical protein
MVLKPFSNSTRAMFETDPFSLKIPLLTKSDRIIKVKGTDDQVSNLLNTV